MIFLMGKLFIYAKKFNSTSILLVASRLNYDNKTKEKQENHMF